MTQVRKPLITMAAIGFVLAGCSTTPAQDGMNGDSSSSMMTSSMGTMMYMSSSSSMAAAMQGAYADGTYSATGKYTSPAGAEDVDVTITIADGVITDAQFKGNATHPASVKWQGNFAAGFTDEVVGKNIDEVDLGVVNGSSLAPKGFMDALAQVKTEAKAS